MKKTNFPETSRIAHQNKTDESKQRDYDDIMRAYRNIGSGIYTDVATFLGWTDAAKVARRMSEMRDKGMLENTGLKKMTPRNRPAFIHQLCEDVKKSPSDIVDDIISLAHKPDFIQQELFP